MRRIHALLASTSLGVGLMAGAVGIGGAGSDEDAPFPRCTRTPASLDQGDDLIVRGTRWEPESTVTISFDDDEGLEDETTDDDDVNGDDDGTTEDSLPDDEFDDEELDDDFVVTDDVSDEGRFRTEFVIPDTAVRGSHSINVVGLDEDGLPAMCSRLVSLSDHPEVDTTQDTGPDDTTGTTEPRGTTPTTGDDNGTTTTTTTTP